MWLSFSQTTETVIDGFEAAWAFFGGAFKVVILDNMSTAVTKADWIEPRLNQASVRVLPSPSLLVIDPARVRTSADKSLSSYCTSSCWFGGNL